VLLLSFLMYPATVTGSEGNEIICLRFLDSPELYDRCLLEGHKDMHKFETRLAPETPDERSCYCDIRKQNQVELRKRKQGGRLQGKS